MFSFSQMSVKSTIYYPAIYSEQFEVVISVTALLWCCRSRDLNVIFMLVATFSILSNCSIVKKCFINVIVSVWCVSNFYGFYSCMSGLGRLLLIKSYL
jgi:hypothetical protein